MTTETLIIGQGIAGTALVLQLAQKKKDFLIVDNSYQRSSSLVAAGLYNPMIFRKPSKSYNADNLIPYLHKFYSHWEKKLNTRFLQPRKIIRVFSSVEECNNWSIKSGSDEYSRFLSPEVLPENFDQQLICEFGGGTVLNAGNVTLEEFLDSTRSYFADKHITGLVSSITPLKQGFEVITESGTIKAEKVILANGHLNHPHFNYLPLTYTKGDVLTIYAPEITGTDIRNKGLFIMPIGDGFHRSGSTHDWENKSYDISKKARIELEEKLKNTLRCPYSIEDQKSGIRPTVGDRRPLLGEHPEHKNLFIFNGLGAKGVMLAPFYSEHLVNHIFEDTELHSEVDIKRYKKHYGHTKN
ncbi:MAG: hypothetical protein CL840_08995 [Crocinitomicaceae bacterium]|nr:hypothetical protein [Crocinitomicaceae bacterium]|tara:strand:+ start:19326 stop:20390 length:1065 start_codon:yes stop_codon:yes gene_type:complete